MESAAKGSCLLRAEKVCLKLSGNLILRDLELEIRAGSGLERGGGQVVALLGPSGVGKTQLLRLLAGLQSPDSGSVRVGPAQELVRAGMVGMVAQHYPLFEHRTVFGNLVVAGVRARLSSKEAHEKAASLLARFRLADRANAYPIQLSGGQRQRVAIAQQFMSVKHLLLMDEPFSGLDPVGVESVCELIREVAAQDASNAILVITHDIGAAIEVADTLWLMGRDFLAEDSPVPGARVQAIYDLAQFGITKRRGGNVTPEFLKLSLEIRERFRCL